MKSFVNDLYEYDYTGEQTKNNEEESSDDEEIDIQITVEENATNEYNKNVIEINCLCIFLFQIALNLKKNQDVFSLTFQN